MMKKIIDTLKVLIDEIKRDWDVYVTIQKCSKISRKVRG